LADYKHSCLHALKEKKLCHPIARIDGEDYVYCFDVAGSFTPCLSLQLNKGRVCLRH